MRYCVPYGRLLCGIRDGHSVGYGSRGRKDPRQIGGGGIGVTTIEQALGLAYRNNPQLNAQRAATRATDENVPTALAGYRPRVTGTSSLTEQYLDTLVKAGSTPQTGALYSQTTAILPCRPSA